MRPLRLGDDAPLARPALPCRPGEVLEHARRPAASRSAALAASASCAAISATSRSLRASPSTKCTPFASHQPIRVSRQKPQSARRMIVVLGQRARICCTMRATSSTLPAAASMFGRPQLRRQQMPPAEHKQRQIAVAVVIAVEEAPLLMAVQRAVGRIQIDHHHAAAPACAPRRQTSTSRRSMASPSWLIL